jgi:hypothetical protein
MTLKNPVFALAFALLLAFGAVAGLATIASGTPGDPAILADTDGGDEGGDDGLDIDVDITDETEGDTGGDSTGGVEPIWLIIIVAIVAIVVVALVAASRRRGDDRPVRDDRPL